MFSPAPWSAAPFSSVSGTGAVPRTSSGALQLATATSLDPHRTSRDDAPKHGAVAVHQADALLAETRDQDVTVGLAPAELANDAAGGVLVYVGLIEDGGTGGTDGWGGVQLRARSAAGEGDEGVAPVEAGVGARDGVATDVVDRVDGVAHRAGSVETVESAESVESVETNFVCSVE
ncbi:hypothetical protein V496_00806 [Pseudogymnoascus sp. VKM F-4515 (FW-2607)]|nr:hypothetical protein V496_00806 [Pseudogymnoascus sp. VKM F-4515 (FW-2607)]